MRIVCDSCGTKYSISDDKVRGKVFKIRCKKCSHVIVVHGEGDGASADDAGSDAGVGGGEAVWYVVLAGQQDGPHTEEQVQGFLSSGEITADTFVWREGFANWLRLAEAEGLSHLASAGAAAAGAASAGAAAAAAASAASASLAFGGGSPFDGADEGSEGFDDVESTRVVSGHEVGQGSPLAPRSPAPAAAASMAAASMGAASMASASASMASASRSSASMGAAAHGGGGLGGGGSFGSMMGGAEVPKVGLGGGGSSGFGALSSMPASSASEDEGGNGRHGMVGARNENSVLFSLSSLQAVNRDDKEAPKNTDASGLIDIQALSSSAAALSSSRSGGGASMPSGDPFGGSSAGPAIAVPAMMPMGTRRSNAPLIIGIVVAVVLVLGLGGVVVALLLKTPQPTTIVQEVQVPASAPGAALAANTAKDDKEEDDEPPAKEEKEEKGDKEGEGAADSEKGEESGAEEGGDEKAPADKKGDTKAVARRADPEPREVARKDDRTPPPTRPEPKEEKKKDPPKGGTDSIDSILGDITGGKKGGDTTAQKQPAKKEDPPAPEATGKKLSKTDVQNTVRRYNSQVGGCGQGASGTAMVKFTILPNGSVGSAQVSGTPPGGASVGGCITRVVRSMKFPASDSSTTITYPFTLR